MDTHAPLSIAAGCRAAVLALALAAPVAHAEDAPDSRWSVKALFGATTMSDQTLQFTGNGPAQRADAALGSGLLTGAAVGYELTPNWHVEAEFTYQSVDHDGLSPAIAAASGTGNFASTGFALNGLYSFNAFGSDRARTYVGLGVAWLSEIDIDFESAGREVSYSGSDVGVQAMAGVRYELGSRWFLDAGLRYLAASGVELDGEDGALGRVKADYAPWSAAVAIGWRF
ncbi:MAG: outer membrane beta-barrel protein [Steroidobacteraceae bacterium]|jgi:outer membrane protein|nr:outer membrane beta-barrel protein [Steroidobacteraceae bacterium]